MSLFFFYQAVPYFFVFILVEAFVRWLQSKPLPRVNDSINSLTAGIMMQLCRLVIGAIEITSYAWIYEHWRLMDLPWDSPVTWWLAFLGVDCGYYWFHRMAHGITRACDVCLALTTLDVIAEVNLFWAAHQAHHSSEDYTLSTALRQSAMQRFTSWVCRVLWQCEFDF